ncbi:MAG TPA: 3-oxoadipate enol-lactonase [Casimicrobiaceae bacterium]|nr:3-oxoadipate enol-lactonase [Casimicrobiaceae bacterium]
MALATLDSERDKFNCRVEGPPDAPVLVLSNSLGTDLSMWDAQMPALTTRFRVLRYDTRGHGASAVTPGPYTIGELGRDVLRLLDALKIRRAHFCGLSMGGMIGMWLGVHAPDRIGRMVLANTAPKIGTPEMWNQRIDNVRKGGMAAIVDTLLERWFTAAFRARAPEAVARVSAMLTATPAEGYCACCVAVRDMDQRDAIAGIRHPTLVIAGTHDAVTPPAEGRATAERIRGARYVELDAAHLSNIEAADRFTTEAVAFIAGEGA